LGLFLDRISQCADADLNRTIMDRILDDRFDLAKLFQLGVGIDIRENIQTSKVKCYFHIQDYPEKMDQVVALHPPIESLGDYPYNEIFGINLYFDGSTDLEIYHSLDYKNLRNATLLQTLKLEKIPANFLEACKSLFISYEGVEKRVLHFYLLKPTEFVWMIGVRQLKDFFGNAQILSHTSEGAERIRPLRVMISLLENEILTKNIEHINAEFYFHLL